MKKPAPRKVSIPKAGVPSSDRRYEVEDAMRTLIRAQEVKANPSLMKEVQAHAASHAGHLKKVARGAKI